MAFERELWSGTYSGIIPSFPCPRCENGRLSIVEGSSRELEPNYSKNQHRLGKSTVQKGRSAESFFMRCQESSCGEVVAVIGSWELRQDFHDDSNLTYSWFCLLKGMYPAPPLIPAPKQTPNSVTEELRVAFQLFWVDLGSCANRLRISVERILDEFQIPPGTLSDRIARFKAIDPEHAETFDALRYVGNVGSHEGNPKRETLLDAFEIYADALVQFYDGRRIRIDALKKKIIAAKGK